MEKDENKSVEVKHDNSQAQLGALRYFSDDSHFVFILKKTEKLASALYLITGFFDHEEPLKWKLRTLSGDLLSQSLELKDTKSRDKEKAIMDMEGIVLEIGSLLLIAKNSGLMSEMNYDIISREFNNFATVLARESKQLTRTGNNSIESGYFDVILPEPKLKVVEKNDEAVEENIKDNYPKKSVSYVPRLDVLDQIESRVNRTDETEEGQKIDEGMLAKGIKQMSQKESKPLKEFGAVAVKKNSRQSIIISLLRRKKEIMIKDVSPLIHGCSEKTIQRELLSMVDKGILRKQGEKRWSRYSLA
jgi:hypothetical protein